VSPRIPVQRAASLPDPLRVARYRRAPELGPRILFLSGGSALRKPCRKLKRYTHNSVHLVTPFDSGGSSAELRKHFGMLSVGDLRNRLLSLADESVHGNPEIYALFSHRFPADARPAELHDQLDCMVTGEHRLVRAVPAPLRQLVVTHLRHFAQRMPLDFDLQRASVGNLILTGGYLANDRDIDSVIFLFSKLVEVRGTVRPVVDADLHLRATLANGGVVMGQHAMTGKQTSPIESPIETIELVTSLAEGRKTEVRADEKTLSLIREAELICFPVGSFYSSVLANLLPRGVGRAIAEAECPKVFVPNMGLDPEQHGMSVARTVARLVEAMRADAGAECATRDLLSLVLIDSERGAYSAPLELPVVKQMGVDVVDLPLVAPGPWPWIDAQRLVEVLLSLA